MNDLAAEFHQTMIRVYEEAKKFDYYAERFRMMLEEHGGLKTARRLLNATNAQQGLTRLWENDRLDLSVEHHILQPRFKELFDENTRKEASNRLKDLDHFVDEDGNLRCFGNV